MQKVTIEPTATFAQPQDTHRSKSSTSFYDSTGASFGEVGIFNVSFMPGRE
jgi:hypothetical protein